MSRETNLNVKQSLYVSVAGNCFEGAENACLYLCVFPASGKCVERQFFCT
jgi:hypothetical protein